MCKALKPFLGGFGWRTMIMEGKGRHIIPSIVIIMGHGECEAEEVVVVVMMMMMMMMVVVVFMEAAAVH